MQRCFTFAACLALAAISLSACSRDKSSPQPVAQPAPAPQEDSDSGDDEDIAAEAIAPQPRISLEPPREVRTPRGFTPAESVPEESAEEAPPEPSIFRSLGRALRRGLTDTVKQAGGEDTSSAPAADPQASEPDSPNQ
jgi:hypothetical protein